MAALALAVGAYLVQTRLPNAECTRNDAGRCQLASPQEIPKRLCAPPASKRCAEVVKHQGALCFRRARLTTACFRAGLRQEDPLNLNILLSGGKETNKDSVGEPAEGSITFTQLKKNTHRVKKPHAGAPRTQFLLFHPHHQTVFEQTNIKPKSTFQRWISWFEQR